MRFVSASNFPVSSEAGSGLDDWERRGTIKVDMAREKSLTKRDIEVATNNLSNDRQQRGQQG
jgi:hypothetical protein